MSDRQSIIQYLSVDILNKFSIYLYMILSFRSSSLMSVSIGEVIEAIKEVATEGNILFTESNQFVVIRWDIFIEMNWNELRLIR